MRLVDVEQIYCAHCPEKDNCENVVCDVKTMPTIDAVPVVRCRECVYKERATVNEKGFLICPASHMEIADDDFCSYGEQREAAYE